MGCISNISGSITYGCLTGAAGIDELLLINYSDIQSISISKGEASITPLPTAKVVPVVSIRKGANALEAIRVNENAPNALQQTVNFTVYEKTKVESDFINTLLNSRVVAVAKMTENGVFRAYGCNYGLEATTVDEDVNNNGGFTSVSLATPEGVYGESRANISEATWNSLKQKVG